MTKYKVGDKVGPYNILLLEDIKTTDYGHRICKFLCPFCKENTFIAKLYHVTSGKIIRCKECRVQQCSGENNVNFKNLLGQKFGKLTVVQYAGNHTAGRKTLTRSLWKCQCDCGNICYKDSNILLQGLVQSCGECNMKSKGEWKIQQLLNDCHIIFKQQYKFTDCKDIFALPFDFYLPEYNMCIEYDGTSHYIPNIYGSWNTEENVERTRAHDLIKNNYCKNNGVSLIRIPYWNYDKLDISYLISLIESHRGGGVDELQSLSESNQ